MGLQTIPGYGALNADGVTAVQHPVELDRNLLKGLFRASGVLRGSDFALTPTGVSQQLSVAAGSAFVLGQETAQQGGYFAWSDAASTVSFGAPSGSPRIDTLLLRIYDPQYGTLPSGTYRAQWDVVAGTPAATPAARPDSDFVSTGTQWVPGAWMKWAEVRINPGDTVVPSGQIYLPGSVSGGTGGAWFGRGARGSSGVFLCPSTSRPSSPNIGDQCYDLDTQIGRRYDGSNWVQTTPYKRTQLLTGNTRPITFNNIPSTLRTITITYTARSANATTAISVAMTINNNTGANYFGQYVTVTNTTMNTPIGISGATSLRVGAMPGNTAGAGQYGSGEIKLIGWNAPHSKLNIMYRSDFYDTAVNSFLEYGGGLINLSGPFTRIDLDDLGTGFMAGSEFVLEGWE